MAKDDSGFEIKECFSNWQKKNVRTIVVNSFSKNPTQRSIASAIAIAKPFDRLELVGGDYLEALSLPISLELVAASGEDPCIVSRNTALTLTGNCQVYFENINFVGKGKTKDDVAAAIFNVQSVFKQCRFSSVRIGGKGRAEMTNCYIEKSGGGVGLQISDEGSGSFQECTVSHHKEACVLLSTEGKCNFFACSFSNTRMDGGDLVVATGLGNKYSKVEPCSQVTMSQCRFSISLGGGGGPNTNTSPVSKHPEVSSLALASYAVSVPCCAVISNGAAPTLDQNQMMEGEVGILLHNAGSAKMRANTIQYQRRCGIVALLQPRASLSPADFAQRKNSALSISGNNIFDHCHVGIDIYTMYRQKEKVLEKVEEANAPIFFCPFASGVQRFSWLDLPEVVNTHVPKNSKSSAMTTEMVENQQTTVVANFAPMSLHSLQFQLRALAVQVLQLLPAALKKDFGEPIPKNSLTESTGNGNFFSQLLFTTLGNCVSAQPPEMVNSAVNALVQEIQISRTIFNHCGLCAIRFGDNSYGSVDQCKFDENDRHAIIIGSGAFPIITGCVFTKSFRSSILVGGFANPLIICNMMQDGGKDAIEVTQSGRGVYLGNYIHASGGTGIVVDQCSYPIICANMIKHNTRGGILVNDTSTPLIAFNVLSVNLEYQIKYLNDSNPCIARNSIQSGLGIGIIAGSEGRGFITRNHIVLNKGGILIENLSDPLIQNNNLDRNQDYGALIQESGIGTLCDNLFIENGTNILITSGGNCVVRGNRVKKGVLGGVVVCQKGRGIVEKNDLDENSVANLIIADSNSSPMFIRNKIHSSGGCGIIVASGAGGELRENYIYENRLCGIYVRTYANPKVTSNFISREAVGVMVSDSGKGTFEDNRFDHILGMGIIIQRNAEPLFSKNEVKTCAYCSVLLGDRAGGVLTLNMLAESRFGLQIGSVLPMEDLSLRSVYFQEEMEPEALKKHLSETGVPEDGFRPVLLKENTITDNSDGGVLVQTAVECQIVSNRIFKNHKYGILGSVGYWASEAKTKSIIFSSLRCSSEESVGDFVVPPCIPFSFPSLGVIFKQNEIFQHEAANVFMERFLSPGVFLFENDIFDSAVGVLLKNESLIQEMRENSVHDCLVGLEVTTGARCVCVENHVSHCTEVGLYIGENGAPDWGKGNIIEFCGLCGILSDGGAAGKVTDSVIRFCPCGIVAMASLATPLRSVKNTLAPTSFASTCFEGNEISQHTLHGVALITTGEKELFYLSKEDEDSRLFFGQPAPDSHRRPVQFLRNTVKQNRVAGFYMDCVSAGEIDEQYKKNVSLKEASSNAVSEAILGTSLLGSSPEHHEERSLHQPYLEENKVVECSMGICIGSQCHPFLKGNSIDNNIFFGLVLRPGSAGMVFGGTISHNGLAGVYVGKSAKGTVSDVHIHTNNAMHRSDKTLPCVRDFTHTPIITVLLKCEAEQKSHSKVLHSRSLTISDEKKTEFAKSYSLLTKWCGAQRFVMIDTLKLLRRVASTAPTAMSTAPLVVPSRGNGTIGKPNRYACHRDALPEKRFFFPSNGGVGVWAEDNSRTTFQQNIIENHQQIGVFYGKSIVSFDAMLEKAGETREMNAPLSGILEEYDYEGRKSSYRGCPTVGAFFSQESLIGEDTENPISSCDFADMSLRSIHSSNIKPRGTPRLPAASLQAQKVDRQPMRQFTLEGNRIERNQQGLHIQLVHDMQGVVQTEGGGKQKSLIMNELPRILGEELFAEDVLLIKGNDIQDNALVGIHCQHVTEFQCQACITSSVAFSDSIHKLHGNICDEWSKSTKQDACSSSPPPVSFEAFPFIIPTCSVSSRRSARICQNNFARNELAEVEVTSQHVVLPKDNSKFFLELDTLAAARDCYASSKVLFHIPVVAALLQQPPPGVFLFEDNRLCDSNYGFKCFGVLCADNVVLCNNEILDMKKDAVSILGHLASATIGPSNSFQRNHVGVRIHVDLPLKTALTSTALNYETRVFHCIFNNQKMQSVMVDAAGGIPVVIHQNTFTSHAYGAVGLLLSSYVSPMLSTIVSENMFTESFLPLLVVSTPGDTAKGSPVSQTSMKLENSSLSGSYTFEATKVAKQWLISKNFFSGNVIGALVCGGAKPHFVQNTFKLHKRAGLEISGATTFPTVEECVFSMNSLLSPQADDTSAPLSNATQLDWDPKWTELELQGLHFRPEVSLRSEYDINGKKQPLSCGILLNPDAQCTTKRCLFDHNDVGIDAVRSVFPGEQERQADFSLCVFTHQLVAGVMSRFCQTIRIREFSLSLTKGSLPKENTIFSENFFFENTNDPVQAFGDVITREYGTSIFRKNVFCGIVHGFDNGYAYFENNSFLPEDNIVDAPEYAIILHKDSKVVASKNLIGKRKIGIESHSYANAVLLENVILRCNTGVRALPLSFSSFRNNRIIDAAGSAMIVYGGEYVANDIVLGKTGIIIKNVSQYNSSIVIPANRRTEGKVSVRQNKVVCCAEEGILTTAVSCEVMSNEIHSCGIGVRLISDGSSISAVNEVDTPCIHSNYIFLNRIGILAEERTAASIIGNDVFGNTMIGVSLDPHTVGKLSNNRISSEKEEDAAVISTETRIKVTGNTIRHRFAPVFNRISLATRKKEVGTLLSSLQDEFDAWHAGWDRMISTQKALYESLTSLNRQQQKVMLDQSMEASGSPSQMLRRFNLTESFGLHNSESSLILGGVEAEVPRSLSISGLKRAESRPRRSIQGTPMPPGLSQRFGTQSTRLKSVRTSNAVSLLLHVVSRSAGRREALQWANGLTELFAQPPLDKNNFRVIISTSKEEMEKLFEESHFVGVVVLIHCSCGDFQLREDFELLRYLHEKIPISQVNGPVGTRRAGLPLPPGKSRVMIGLVPEDMTLNLNQKSKSEEGNQYTLASFCTRYRCLTYKKSVDEIHEKFSTVLLDCVLHVNARRNSLTLPTPRALQGTERRISDAPDLPSNSHLRTLEDVAKLMSLIDPKSTVDEKKPKKKKKKNSCTPLVENSSPFPTTKKPPLGALDNKKGKEK